MVYTGGNPLLASRANSFPAWPAKVEYTKFPRCPLKKTI